MLHRPLMRLLTPAGLQFACALILCGPSGCSPFDPTLIPTDGGGGDGGEEAVCGDGVVSGIELCDTAIAASQPGACPSDCAASDPCTESERMGEGCDARCVERAITAAIDDDGCCPTGLNSTVDDDCPTACDNGVLEQGETCDPVASCPTAADCSIDNSCVRATFQGTATDCTSSCQLGEVTACNGGDGCCPATCNSTNDNDCSASCGNGTIEGNETCEPNHETMPCPNDCSDGDACTEDIATGSTNNCNVECTNQTITEPIDGDACCPPGANAATDDDCDPVCGNGVREPGEECDDGNLADDDACSSNCEDIPPAQQCLNIALSVGRPDDACTRCACERCTDEAFACYASGDDTRDQQCTEIIACAREESCSGAACYCGTTSLSTCSFCCENGPCASRWRQTLGVTSNSAVLTHPVLTDQAAPLGDCLAARCASECDL